MNIQAAYYLTGSLRDAAELAGCLHGRAGHGRAGGRPLSGAAAGVSGAFLPKLEEFVDRSKGKIRADKAREKTTAMGAPLQLRKILVNFLQQLRPKLSPTPGTRAAREARSGREAGMMSLWAPLSPGARTPAPVNDVLKEVRG
jgi:hypothetical protein